MKRLFAAAGMLITAAVAPADSIRIGQTVHNEVVVATKAGEYVVLLPKSGETLTVSTKRSDVKVLLTSPPKEREALLNQWERAKPATLRKPPQPVPAPKAEPAEPAAPKTLTTQDARATQNFRELAEFETQLVLWAQIPDAVRKRAFRSIARRANSTATLNMERAAELAEVRAHNHEAIGEELDQLGEVRKDAQAEIATKQRAIKREVDEANFRAYLADSSTKGEWEASIANSYESQARLGEITGKGPGLNRVRAAYWANEALAEELEEEAQIAGIYAEHGARAKALENEAKGVARQYKAQERSAAKRVQALEEANSATVSDTTVLKLNAEDGLARAGRALSRMQQLEDALTGGYVLSLPFRQVLEAEMSGDSTKAFSVRGPLWRVMWGVSGGAQGSKAFKLSVVNDQTGKPIAGSTDDVDGYRRFLLLQVPGLYSIKVTAPAGTGCVVWVDEVRAD